ncbi:hypothetical protein HO173_012481 [Letharia columbiana]|uniref:Uncharacterized protein n=1 Tax=Letharia columbiana TaxID=112416 RepID=A0A8H6FFH6_9LECA|nr:uncharacterized protein HO173_012481 [Letharia columbiana]KAF6226582.1 hypothetical protein HO173_012481 [Letharia columbiana]
MVRLGGLTEVESILERRREQFLGPRSIHQPPQSNSRTKELSSKFARFFLTAAPTIPIPYEYISNFRP